MQFSHEAAVHLLGRRQMELPPSRTQHLLKLIPTEMTNQSVNLQPISKQSMWAYIAQTCSNWDLIPPRTLLPTEQCNNEWDFGCKIVSRKCNLTEMRSTFRGLKTARIWDAVTRGLCRQRKVNAQSSLWLSLLAHNVLGLDVWHFSVLAYSIGYHPSADHFCSSFLQNNGGWSLSCALGLLMVIRQSTTLVQTEV